MARRIRLRCGPWLFLTYVVRHHLRVRKRVRFDQASVYAKCIAGQQDEAKRRIEDAMKLPDEGDS